MKRILRLVLLGGCVVAPLAAMIMPGVATAGVPGSQRCDVTIQASGAEPLGALELRVDYSQAGGQFVDDGEEVECVGLAPGAYASARNDQAGEELDLGMISAIGVALPQDFWRCTFESSSGVPTAAEFDVIVDDALDPELTPVVATASVSAIACDGQSECGNGAVEGPEECDDAGPSLTCDANCELTANTQRCAIGFRVSGAGTIGGIQFRVNYAGSNGEFEGSGVNVQCSEALESALTAVEDRDADDELRLALISATGLALPVDLWECIFVTNAVSLQLESFLFENVIATDESIANVPVNITAISTSCVYGPYCGDGNVDPGEACDDGNKIAGDACTNSCTIAVCGDGIVRSGVEQCDDGNSNAADCCSNGCTNAAGTTVCRAAAGICDLAENCTGSSGACPPDAKKSTVCRPSAGVCDVAELCDGSATTCPANVLTTVVCRTATGVCDLTESCSGTSASCPVDGFQTSGVACTTDENTCTTDQCNGAGVCSHTGNAMPCNDGLFCNGADTCAGGTCSMHAGNPCPGADGDGDCSESCSESTDNCNGNDPDASVCNDNNASTTGDQCKGGLCVAGTGGVVCGDADSNGSVNATDALRILRAAVGQPVTCPGYLCDADGNSSVTTTDALRVLKKSVGQVVTLTCPPKPA